MKPKLNRAGERCVKHGATFPSSTISIADAKRGDIGNSSERYVKIFLHELKFDAVTVNAYMGRDSVAPFLQSREQCAFILAVTSNPGAKDFQHLKIGKKFLYEKIIETALTWNAKKNVGFVAGATKPKELRSIRKKAPAIPLLIPGVGTQGGSIETAVRYGCDNKGYLAVINASRSIIYASNGENFAEAARAEAIKLREEINYWRGEIFQTLSTRVFASIPSRRQAPFCRGTGQCILSKFTKTYFVISGANNISMLIA